MRRLLIANRGEIVGRIARTAAMLGVETVGVYSDPDAGAMHVGLVDKAVALGGAAPADSYLDIAKLLDAAARTAADAVHPGYGFLAESASFARAVIEAGLVWVGPTPEQIELMGDKVAAKKVAADAGVPVLESAEPADAAAVGFPLLVKAAAGGGGRGMRLVTSAAELDDAVAAARREAEAAFGDGTVFVERYVTPARHVEVQVLGDSHGNVVHLFERECSVQRRNQKLIEETPSPGIDEAIRTSLCDAAVRLASAVGYLGAGTVEFVVGRDGGFSFLEMNTRLQVEHPVTEAVTGYDLVELQLRVADGQRLGITQGDVAAEGHAIEARLVAEDPAAGWLPVTGRFHRFAGQVAAIRWDAGYRTGSEVSPHYDSLLAKAVVHRGDRQTAALALAGALAGLELHGPTTNRDFLVRALRSEPFLAGRTHTSFVDDHPELSIAPAPPAEHLVAAVLRREAEARAGDRLWGFAPSGWRNLATQGQRARWSGPGGEVDVEYRMHADGSFDIAIGGQPHHGRRLPGTFELDGVVTPVRVHEAGGWVWVNSADAQSSWRLLPRFVDHADEMVGGGPVAPLPGTVLAVEVEAGQDVEANDLLVVLEAMKMEHRITAPAAARVVAVLVKPGDQVDVGQLLVELEQR